MGKIYYMTIEDFLTKYLKNHTLFDSIALIISNDITASIKTNGNNFSVTNMSGFIEKDKTYSLYDNIEFIPPLAIRNDELLLHSEFHERFLDDLYNRYMNKSCIEEFCCMVDLAVNDDMNVVLISSFYEYCTGFFEVIVGVIEELFGAHVCNYNKFLEKRDTDNITDDIGNVEEINEKLKNVIKTKLNIPIKSIDGFFNWLSDDLLEKYSETLNSKSVSELSKMCKANGIRVRVNTPKEELINKLYNKYKEETNNESWEPF